MKRLTKSIIIACAIFSSALGCLPESQADVLQTDWDKLCAAANKENWNSALDMSERCLTEMKPDDTRMPRLRYLNMYVMAGKYSEGGMSFEQLSESLKKFEGKEVATPYREIRSGGGLNFLWATEEDPTHFMVSASNSTGTTIHAFEYVTLKKSFDWKSNEGKTASINAVIDSISPSQSRALVMRVQMSQGEIRMEK